jgi:hypothetical protein
VEAEHGGDEVEERRLVREFGVAEEAGAGEVAGAALAVLEEEAELIGFYRGEHFSLGAVARRLGVREP